jgi:hypothetical protein
MAWLKSGVYTTINNWWYSKITKKWYTSEKELDIDTKLFILKSRKEKLLKLNLSSEKIIIKNG